jgi:hypothetical protein
MTKTAALGNALTKRVCRFCLPVAGWRRMKSVLAGSHF